MDKINETKRDIIKECQNILDKNDKQSINDLNFVEKLMLKDNTEPVVIKTYLKLLQKFNNEEFLEAIKKYEHFLSKESFDNEFSKVYQKKLSSSELFSIIYKRITEYNKNDDSEKKLDFYQNLVFNVPIYDETGIKGFTDYQRNRELTIYILVQNIIKGLMKRVNNIKNIQEKIPDPTILLELSILRDAEKLKKVIDYDNKKSSIEPTPELRQFYESRKQFIEKDIDKTIEEIKEEINLRKKINSEDFSTLFYHIKFFLTKVKENFDTRFKNLENLKDNDFILLNDFCLFLQHYDFNNFKDVKFYVQKWNDTFKQTTEDIQNVLKDNNIKDFIEFNLENDDLILRCYDTDLKEINKLEIKNINKYCINLIVPYLIQTYSSGKNKQSANFNSSQFLETKIKINDYDIENCLKFDCIEDLYINKKWNIFEDHLVKIFMSPVIKSALEEINKKISISEGYNFLNEKDLRALFRRARIFQFPTSFYGLTEPSLLLDYIYYKGKDDNYKEERSKLSNLCSYQVTQEHEMLGHINIRIQNYLFEKEIFSPISNCGDNYGKIVKEKESGIYIEMLVYGKTIDNPNLNEILFILDEENYNVELDLFRKKFGECTKTRYRISKSLSILLDALDIKVTEQLFEDDKLIEDKELTKKSFSKNNVFNFRSKSHSSILHPDPNLYKPIQTGLYKTLKWISETPNKSGE